MTPKRPNRPSTQSNTLKSIVSFLSKIANVNIGWSDKLTTGELTVVVYSEYSGHNDIYSLCKRFSSRMHDHRLVQSTSITIPNAIA